MHSFELSTDSTFKSLSVSAEIRLKSGKKQVESTLHPAKAIVLGGR